MNYYQPRQVIGEDGEPGGWRYTCRNDNRIWAVGDCAHHDPHATKEEAYECYTAYLLANEVRLDSYEEGVKRKCVAPDGCEEWTEHRAMLDCHIWPLCDSHRTPETVAVLFGTVGDSISSW